MRTREKPESNWTDGKGGKSQQSTFCSEKASPYVHVSSSSLAMPSVICTLGGASDVAEVNTVAKKEWI